MAKPMSSTAKTTDDKKTTYIVEHAHRVGSAQRWYRPGDNVRLLPCAAQYGVSRGWLRHDNAATVQKKATLNTPPNNKE